MLITGRGTKQQIAPALWHKPLGALTIGLGAQVMEKRGPSNLVNERRNNTVVNSVWETDEENQASSKQSLG